MKSRWMFLAIIPLLIGGCAISTAKLTIDLPKVEVQGAIKGKVFVRNVVDHRLEAASSNIIGVKVGAGGGHIIMGPPVTVYSYGGPIRGAHILIENHNSVGDFLKKNLETIFQSKGYATVHEIDTDVVVVDAELKTVWVSAVRGLKMKIFSRINVGLSMYRNKDKQVYDVQSDYSKSYHAATDKRYKEIFIESMNQFNIVCKDKIKRV